MPTWSPARVDSTYQKQRPTRSDCDVFYARLPWQGMVKLYKGSIFSHYGDTICHLRSGYVTTTLHGTSSADATIMRYFQTELCSRFYRRRMPATLIWPRQSIDRSCQSSEMATLLNSLYFVFKIPFVPNRLKGPFKCYVTLFFLKLDPHPPPRNANNIEHYTFVTLFSGKSDTPHPHLRYVTLEWPPRAISGKEAPVRLDLEAFLSQSWEHDILQ